MSHRRHFDSGRADSNDQRSEVDEQLTRRQVIKKAAAIGGGLLASGSGLLGAARAGDQKRSGALQYRFPDHFLWGAGTSGLQHEGSPLAEGAGPSAMYRWAHAAQKEKVTEPDWFTPPIHTFDVSADFYRRFGSDIQLMRELNLQAYNFEVYWPRIFPEGTGKVNPAGLDFYDRLVDAFLGAGIVPLCNLYVFDHPAALQERGGWLNRDMAQWYADYAAVLYQRLGDRVPYWTTICEIPIVHAFTSGAVAPAPEEESASLRAQHHLLLGQGLAVHAFRASGAKGEIGNQHNLVLHKPASDREADIVAAERANAYSNLLLLDSQMRGEYPRMLVDWLGEKWPADAVKDGDMAIISSPIDFFGLDYGTSRTVRHDSSEEGGLLQSSSVMIDETAKPYERTGSDVKDSLHWIRDRYGNIPIIILENGESVEDIVVDGRVDDSERLVYFREYLTGVYQAIIESVDVRGSFVWSFLDGWEFGFGLSRRYGLIHVDFKTQQRIVKASGHWYRDLIRAGGFNLADVNLPFSGSGIG